MRSESGDDQSRRAWLEATLDRLQGPLLRYACSILKDGARAQDVVQEAFLKLWRQPPADLAHDVAPWLFTVCRNLALDVLRKEQRMVPLPPEAHLVAEPAASDLASAGDGLSGVLEALSRLPPKQQEAIRLKFQSGLSYKDISQITGASVSHVGVLIHTGLKALRHAVGSAPTPVLSVTKGGAQ